MTVPLGVRNLLRDLFGPVTLVDWTRDQLGYWSCTIYQGKATLVVRFEREDGRYVLDSFKRL